MERLKTPKQHEDIMKMISLKMETARPDRSDQYPEELKYQISIKSENKTLSYLVISFSEAEVKTRILNFFENNRHPNVVDFYGHIKMPKKTFLVFENLYTSVGILIRRKLWYYKLQAKIILYQILKGLIFLHNKNLMHRDICPENIMISHKGVVKLMGFRELRSIAKSLGETTVGTVGYQSPEVLGNLTHNEKVDVFGFGLVAYECYYGKRFVDCDLNAFKTWTI